MQNLIQTLNVALDERAYPIHIGCGVLSMPALDLAAYQAKKSGGGYQYDSCAAVSRIAAVNPGKCGISTLPVILPDGEQYKTWET
jgi:3-dehydroquinate synthetase